MIIIGIIVWISFIIGVATLAKRYKRSVTPWVLCAIFLSPVVAYVLLLSCGVPEEKRIGIFEKEQIRRRFDNSGEQIKISSYQWDSFYSKIARILAWNNTYIHAMQCKTKCYMNEETLQKLSDIAPKSSETVQIKDGKIETFSVTTIVTSTNFQGEFLSVAVDTSLPEDTVEIRFE